MFVRIFTSSILFLYFSGLLFVGNVLLTQWNQSKLSLRAKITVIWFLRKLKRNPYLKCKAHRGLVTAYRQRCLSYYTAKTRNPQSIEILWIIPAFSASLRSLLPHLPPLWTSELWHKRMRERRSGAATECSTVLHPGEEKSRTSYHMLHFLFLLYYQRNMQKSLPLLYS